MVNVRELSPGAEVDDPFLVPVYMTDYVVAEVKGLMSKLGVSWGVTRSDNFSMH